MNKEIKRFAVSRLHLKDGSILKNQVVEIDAKTNQVAAYYPLIKELAFTEWRGGDYII